MVQLTKAKNKSDRCRGILKAFKWTVILCCFGSVAHASFSFWRNIGGGGRANVALELDREQQKTAAIGNTPHQVAGLSCKRYGGPSDSEAAEMVYWKDIPSDALFESPFKRYGPQVKVSRRYYILQAAMLQSHAFENMLFLTAL